MFALNLGNLQIKLLADTTMYTKALRGAQTLLNGTASKMKKIGTSMSLYLTTPLSLVGGAALRAYGNFDDAMTKSLAIMGNVGPEMRKEMEETARGISERSATSATDLAKSYYFLASAGLDAKQSVASLSAVQKFASAGAFDMALATDLLTDAQSALGLTVKDPIQNMKNMIRISDALTKANTLANASTQQFSEALTNKSAGALRLLNKDLEEGVGVLAAFADQGVKGTEAGEKLYIVLRDLQRASLKGAKNWEKMGMRVYDANGKMLPLVDIIEQISLKFDTMSDKEKKAAAEMLGFQDRSFIAIQTLLGMQDKIRGYTKELYNAQGITEEVANKQLASFNAQMKMLWNQIVNVGAEIGSVLAPWMARLSEYIKGAIRWWRGLSDETKQWIVGIGILVGAAGPLLVALGMIAGSISSIITLLTSLGITGMMWIGVAGLIVGAMAICIDAFTEAKLGVLDFIYSIRLGGLKVETWLTSIAVSILKAWEWVVFRATQVWESLKIGVIEVGAMIYRYYLWITKGLTDSFFWTVNQIASAFIWLAKKALQASHKIRLIDDDELSKGLKVLDAFKNGVKSMGDSVSGVIEKEINGSLENSRKRWMEYDDTMRKTEKDYEEAVRALNEVEKNAIDKDVNEYMDAQRRSVAELGDKAAKVMEQETPKTAVPTVPKAVSERMTNEFQQVNLKRFSIAGMSAGAKKEKQEVSDPQMAGKMDTLIQVVREKKAAVFAE